MKPIRTDVCESNPDGPERDACAIYMSVRKQGQSTFGTLKRSLGALVQMGHRTGFVNGEGDGAGVQTDIPRRLWAKKLSQAGLPSYLATQPGFWVGHLFVPRDVDFSLLRDEVTARFNDVGLNLLIQQLGRVRKEALGQNARINPPEFWQVAGYADLADLEQRLLQVQIELEQQYHIHVVSLSSYTVVYKMRGSVEALSRYYPDLQDHNYDTSIVLCHARYSTNTISNFERAQPFPILGHNGEINTINRLRLEARQIGAVLPGEGSDSQDMDRLIHTLCVQHGLNLIEAMEMVFPPVPHEIALFPPDLQAAYNRLRQTFGPYAQGPAGVVARYGNTIVASVDALGLRPLWFVETEKEYVFSSERGAIPLEQMVANPRPLAPGEKMAICFHRGEKPDVLTHDQIRQQVMIQTFQREAPQLARLYWAGWNGRQGENQRELPATVYPLPNLRLAQRLIPFPVQVTGAYIPEPEALDKPPERMEKQPRIDPVEFPWLSNERACRMDQAVLAANGWLQEHVREAATLVSPKKDDLVSSLGYDGPLAAISRSRVNLADYFKEAVAVVTNPAIDHAREQEVFSTSSLVGACPPIGKAPDPNDVIVTLDIPILLGGHPALGKTTIMEKVAHQYGTLTMEQLIDAFGQRIAWLTLGVYPGETVRDALERLARQSVDAVDAGVQCLILDDAATLVNGFGWLDPHLATSAIDEALRRVCNPENLRRRAGLIVRSGAIRTLHDVALLCGFGADAINPYLLMGVCLKADEQPSLPDEEAETLLVRLMDNLKSGLQKVTSTMGCHELRGYSRVCASIGLSPSVAEIFQSPNYFGSEEAGLTWNRLDEESAQRGAELRGEVAVVRLGHVNRFYPKFWKIAASYARSEVGYGEVRKAFQMLSSENPVALRHIIGIQHVTDVISPMDVDLSIREYSLPLVIDAMSFGSQGETSYRSYAHAASVLNILCINGEGGELPEMMGVYKRHRGQQVASGRFGVNVEFLNSAAVLEIKIGQGAKPGEGGMLPGYKITPQVARARRTPPNVTLLSPSNNHDLYSIEDLAQLIEELRMVNPHARISVKVPVVPGIGVIAVGIAKAGADIINISGYDGGTGAARKHSLQYAGLPTEIGVIQAHRALVDAGIRHKVELWANGGMKTGEDAVKMILLGANRVGFATMAMVAIGCTICRQCNLGTCHVGIATQIRSVEEAQAKGLRSFNPLVFAHSVDRIVRMFKGIGEEMRLLTAQLGATRLQDLVGRADLLQQIAMQDRIDLSPMFEPVPMKPRAELEPGVGILLIRPRNSLTSILSELVMNTVTEGEREVTYQDTVMAFDRALGARLAGELIRQPEMADRIDCLHLRFGPSALAGNGFAAWVTDKMDVLIEGGAQDGVAKGAAGGRVAVMKGLNHEGLRIDGSVGKGFAYGAQNGTLIVQGNADSRACVRLSGAEVIFGGEITSPIDDSKGISKTTANLKGFACEYMTAGTVVILGDPGPYAFSGMTGGLVYQQLSPEMGFDESALRRRLAIGASVAIQPLDAEDVPKIQKLLGSFIEALEQTYQYDEAERMRALSLAELLRQRFVKVVPVPLPM